MFPRDAHHLCARGACDLAHFRLLWSRARHVLCPVAVQRSLKYTQTLLLFFFRDGGGRWWPMQLRWAIITYAFIFVLIGTIAGPPPPPSLLRGGQHQSRSAAFLIQLDVPAARGLSRSSSLLSGGGGCKAKPTSIQDHCLYYPCRLPHLWGAAARSKGGGAL